MPDRAALTRVVVPLLIVVTALVVMVARLGEPERIIFDEVYYVNDARDFLEAGVEDGFVVHPPLGKLLIASSIRIAGDTPFGWRLAGALAGVLTVWLVFLIGRRLFRRTAPAALAALLLTVDGVFLVQARTAMLDVFLALFTVLGAWLLLKDRDAVREADDALEAEMARATDPPDDPATDVWPGDPTVATVPRPPTRTRLPGRDRTWLWLAGAAFGAAVAVKWSGLFGLAAAGLWLLGSELGRRHRLTGSTFTSLHRVVGLGVGALLLAPALVYGATWIPWMTSYDNSYQATKSCDDVDDCTLSVPRRVQELGKFHKSMADFHLGLEADHPYRAPAYTWPVLNRPVVYYYESCNESREARSPKTEDETGEVTIPEPCVVEPDNAAEMLAVGNPALWWPFLLALPLLFAGAVRRDRHSSLPLVFYAVQFLPWLIVSRPVFSFYTVPIVPFVALGLGAAITTLLDGRPVLRVLGGAVSMGVLGAASVGILDALGRLTPTRPVYLVVAGVAFALGGVLGVRSPDAEDALEHRPRSVVAGRWSLRVIAVAGVALAVWFFPVWTGIELPTDVIKQRWWFSSWV